MDKPTSHQLKLIMDISSDMSDEEKTAFAVQLADVVVDIRNWDEMGDVEIRECRSAE